MEFLRTSKIGRIVKRVSKTDKQGKNIPIFIVLISKPYMILQWNSAVNGYQALSSLSLLISLKGIILLIDLLLSFEIETK